jgi:hypothetical protein
MTIVLASQATQRLDGLRDEALPEKVKIPELLLSQSGSALMDDPMSRKPLVPGAPAGYFTKLEIMGLDQSQVHNVRTYTFDADGRIEGLGQGPHLGVYPYEITLVGKDGARYSAKIDVSSKHSGVRHSGYAEIGGLELTRSEPPPPPMPAEVTVPSILLSQFGQALMKDPMSRAPLIPGAPPGFFQKLEITALDESQVHFTHTYKLDGEGRLSGMGEGPWLGDLPYMLTLVGKDGERYQAYVDISSKKTGVRHSGYEDLSNLRFHRVGDSGVSSDAPLDAATRELMQRGPAPKARASVERSPQFLVVSSRNS